MWIGVETLSAASSGADIGDLCITDLSSTAMDSHCVEKVSQLRRGFAFMSGGLTPL